MKKNILSLIAVVLFCFGAIAQNVNIPDTNFKSYLVGSATINTNMDAEIQVSEAEAYTGAINCNNQGINDLTGIEAFTALQTLRVDNNNLSTLDVSQNSSLQFLHCKENNLATLDVSQNLSLIYLFCRDNNLSALDISQNTAITEFDCRNNQISTLDISQNLAMSELYISSNNLTELNLKNINPVDIHHFYATSNPNLTCIEVDDVAVATAEWTNIDPQTSFSTSCTIAVTSINVQGQAGASAISILGGTLQMEAEVLPMNATDNTYIWSVVNGTGSATISTNGLLAAMTDGTVTVTAIANDGSGVTGDAVITISNQTSDINEQNIVHNLSLNPNPVSTQILIDTEAKIETITIIDITGKIVKTIVESNNTIDVSDLSKGIYFLQFQIKNSLVSRKIIKE